MLVRIPVNDLLESIEEKMDSSHGQVCRKSSCGESVSSRGSRQAWGELIVLSPGLSYDDCLVFNLGKMIEDKTIDHESRLFEELIEYARSCHTTGSPSDFSDQKAPGLFAGALVAAFTEGPKALGKHWKKGRHYAIRDTGK
jgi:hypothetical protein